MKTHAKGQNITEKLRSAFELVQRYPADVQDEIATHIFEALEEHEWDAIVRNPRMRERIGELADEALSLYQQGKVKNGGFGTD
jgi:hypothetical protein